MPTDTPGWTNVTSTITGAPGARTDPASTFDPDGGYGILFGGGTATATYGDTWLLIGRNWVKLNLPVSPSPRGGAAMVWDAADHEAVLFGGSGNSGYLNDTWTFEGAHWTQVHPVNSPPARVGAAMAYDGATHQVILFGGYGNNGYLNDTWVFAGGQWTQLAPATPPSPRLSAKMAYDWADRYVVLFGGTANAASSGGGLSDTWTFSGGQWTQLSPTTHPPVRDDFNFSYDQQGQYVLFFGGWQPNVGAAQADTWTFSRGQWNELYPTPSPPARGGAAMFPDPRLGGEVLFGGSQPSMAYADTWVWRVQPG